VTDDIWKMDARYARRIVENNPGMPFLLAWPDGAGLWKVWCPHCRAYHHHGAEEGHRVAHCSSGPYETSGYMNVRHDRAGWLRQIHLPR
jgi:hypothetical protein